MKEKNTGLEEKMILDDEMLKNVTGGNSGEKDAVNVFEEADKQEELKKMFALIDSLKK